MLEQFQVPTGIRPFLKFCGSDPDKNDRLTFYFGVLKLNYSSIHSEKNRKNLIDKKIKELNARVETGSTACVPDVQGTKRFFNNPRMMRKDLLTQEDGGTECSK